MKRHYINKTRIVCHKKAYYDSKKKVLKIKAIKYEKWLEALEADVEEFSQKVKQIETKNRKEKIRILEDRLRRINIQNYSFK